MILLKFLWVKRDYSSESEGGSKKKHAWVMMEDVWIKTRKNTDKSYVDCGLLHNGDIDTMTSYSLLRCNQKQ